jgi:hypothetical protein
VASYGESPCLRLKPWNALSRRSRTTRTTKAVEEFYTVNASMRENQSTPRLGRDAHVAREREVLAKARTIHSKCVRPLFIAGDRVVIRSVFRALVECLATLTDIRRTRTAGIFLPLYWHGSTPPDHTVKVVMVTSGRVFVGTLAQRLRAAAANLLLRALPRGHDLAIVASGLSCVRRNGT